jgi:hypothetical protein
MGRASRCVQVGGIAGDVPAELLVGVRFAAS